MGRACRSRLTEPWGFPGSRLGIRSLTEPEHHSPGFGHNRAQAEASRVMGPLDLFIRITDPAGHIVAASGSTPPRAAAG